jgi:uncharacterized protein
MTAKCPICQKPADLALRPFCSKRCADLDLQRWFTGRYVIPAKASEVDQEVPDAPDDEDA